MTKQNSKPNDSLPHSLEAERSVLGAVLLDSHSLPAAIEILSPLDFFLGQHVHIFSAMVDCYERHVPVDIVTLMDSLERSNDLENAGGIPYLSSLADGLPHLTHIEHYARIVKEKSILRAMAHAAEAIGAQALAGDESSDEVLSRAKDLFNKLAEQQPKPGPIHIRKVVEGSYTRIENMVSSHEAITGLPTGYSGLDIQLAGLQAADLIVLAARPSMGKTAMALNIAENVTLKRKEPVLMFSLEMSKESLLMRVVAARARINAHKFRTGHLNQEDMTRMIQALEVIREAPFWIDDSSSATIMEIAARAERVKRENSKIGLVIVDYIQLVAPGSRRGASRQEQVSEISRGLKGLAKDLQVPVIALSQLTRAPEQESRRPQLSDLRESGAIEQDADVVLFIHRPHFYKKEATAEDRAKSEIVIAKQRNGPTGTVHFVFLDQYTRFEEAAPDSWEAGLGGSA